MITETPITLHGDDCLCKDCSLPPNAMRLLLDSMDVSRKERFFDIVDERLANNASPSIRCRADARMYASAFCEVLILAYHESK